MLLIVDIFQPLAVYALKIRFKHQEPVAEIDKAINRKGKPTVIIIRTDSMIA